MTNFGYIYLRIFGYIATIVLHVSNIVCMAMKLQTDEVKELFKDPEITFFNENQARYFTCWTFFLQIVYAVIGLTCDILTLKNCGSNEEYQLPKHLRGARDTLFAGIQWPSTFLVSTLFWSLFKINRELILPEILDKALSRASNHVIHTAIVPVVLWEIVFQPRTEPRTHWRNLGHMTFHYVLYFSVLFYTYYEKGTWIYPIFKVTAGTLYFPLFMLIVYGLLIFFYYIQWPITRYFHGSFEKNKRKIR